MNDATPLKASLEEMEAAVMEGRRILERIEKGFEKLDEVWGKGYAMGMMPREEFAKLSRETKKLLKSTLALHAKGTAVAQRNGADGVLPAGGPGR